VPERINAFDNGNSRFIYMIRNPIARIESQARHALFAGWGRSMDYGMDEDLIAYSKHHLQLEQYLNHFDKKKFKIIKLEDLEEDANSCLKDLCQFLEIDDNYEFSEVKRVRNSGEFFNNSSSIAELTQSKFGTFVSKNLIPKKMKDYIRSSLIRYSKKKAPKENLGRWKLTDVEKDKIRTALTEDLRKLEAKFNLNLSDYL
jgi:hypothetical protein